MFTSEAVRLAAASPSQPLAWPVIGTRRTMIGTSSGAENDVRALQQIGTKLRVSRGKTIFNEGDPAENAYKVVNGTVRLCKHMADGRRQIAQFAFPGDFVSFMEGSEHNFTAEAVTDVVLMCYPQRQIDKLGVQKPSVRDRFLTLMCQRVCDMQNLLMVLGRQTAKERVASFLLMLLERIGFEEDDILDVPMSRQDIADNLGLTIETVCRTLSDLKRAGVIDIPNQRQLQLLDVEALQSLAAGED
jgi:CRP-like cAMP-binding protein